MNCPQCQTANPPEARFCFHCGAALPQKCKNCASILQPGARFCHNCGQPVGAAETTPPAAAPARGLPEERDSLQRYIPRELLARLEAARRSQLMVGERRVVTILFCDVKGSSLAASRMDPEEWAEIMNGAFTHMIRPVYRYEGTVARLQGDGLLAFFGAPIAHEDDPQRAVLAGQQIVEAVHAYGEEVKQRWGIDFEVRVGINTGLVVVGEVGSDLRVEYSALGDAINMAARMEQTAEPGSVQVAEATYKLVAPLFDFQAIEGLAVKGRETPVRAYRLLGRSMEPGSLRGIAGLNAPLIGRRQQMLLLWSALDSLKEGQGRILSVVGEAGLGKSRLIAEFARAATADPTLHLQWLEGRSLSYESSIPFAPFLGLFGRFFGFHSAETDQAKYERILNRCEDLFPGQGEQIAPFFATLLGIELAQAASERVKYLEPPHLRSLIFAQATRLVQRLLKSQPVVLYLDDLHWIDPTSLELLQSLLPITDQAPLLIITAFRPRSGEAATEFSQNAEREYPHRHQTIALEPLAEDQSRELVASLLHIEDLPEGVRQKVFEKAEGNPFYVEEIIRSLMDGGLIVRENGSWRAAREIGAIALPDTLAGVITARLDRLDESSRHVIQVASVVGREFSPGILTQIVESTIEVSPALVILQNRELVREKSQSGQSVYTFKHILTQETVYQSILLSNRRELHRRTAEALIAQPYENAAEIARHLIDARQAARAAPYLLKAGERAARAYATEEAIRYYRQVLELRASLDPGTLRQAFEGLGGALSFAARIPEALAVYEEMLGQAEASGDMPMQISALNKLAGITGLQMGQLEEAERYLDRAEALAHQVGEKMAIPEAAIIRCQMCTIRADFESVPLHMDKVIQIGKETGLGDYVAMGLEHIASSLVYMTRFDEALEKAQEGLKVARQVGNREKESSLLSETLPLIYLRNGDFETAQATLQEGLKIATMIGSLAAQAIAGYLLAEIARWRGEYETALHFGRRALEAGLPLEPYMPFYLVPALGSLGMIYLEISEHMKDQIGEFHLHALRLLESPVAMISGGAAWAALGWCALALGDLEVAETMFEKGLDHPNLFMRLERPRMVAGAALLACSRGETGEALRLANEARQYAEERRMRHYYPLAALVQGKVLKASGDFENGLEAFEKAEAEAMALEMRPIAWQARAGAAKALEASGASSQAQAKRDAARAMIEEIAGLFKDETLREAYLQNTLAKLSAPESTV